MPTQIIRRDRLYPYTSVKTSLKTKVIGQIKVAPLRTSGPSEMNFDEAPIVITITAMYPPTIAVYRAESWSLFIFCAVSVDLEPSCTVFTTTSFCRANREL